MRMFKANGAVVMIGSQYIACIARTVDTPIAQFDKNDAKYCSVVRHIDTDALIHIAQSDDYRVVYEDARRAVRADGSSDRRGQAVNNA